MLSSNWQLIIWSGLKIGPEATLPISLLYMAVRNNLLLLLVIVSCLLMLTSCSNGHYDKEHIPLFVFGDSLSDSGNNNYINTTPDFQANYWPYGVSYFNPASGRFSDGRIVSDFIAEYAGLPLIPTYLDPRNDDFLYGANFASGGAGALVESNAGFVVDLKTQLEYFGDLEKQFRQKLGDAKAEQLLANAVYILNGGGNDYFSSVGNNDSILYPYTHDQYVGMVIGNLTDVIKGIYEKGGRKFGIATIPLLACWPSVRAGRADNTCNEELDIISRLHSQKLSEKLQELENQLNGFMYAKFDLATAVSNRMNNPSKYGFKVGDSACCGTGPFRGIDSCGGKREVKEYELCDNISDYLFFDSNHCTEVANRQYAELFWDGDSSVTTPYNLKAFFHTCYGNKISKHVALFVFGDSLYDPGNNNYINTTTDFQANFWPYGVSYFDPPSGRFSDGRLIPDFIAEFAGLPLIPTYLDPRNHDFTYGANFASGGAGALVESHAGFVVDLKTQLRYFEDIEKQFRQNLGDAETNQLLSDAVYLFSCGGNDYLSPVGNNDSILYPYTHEEYVGMVIGNLTNVFKGLYGKGGRKFGIVTVPPLACWPSIRADRPGNTCSEEIGIIVSLHNQKLSKKLQELENQLEGFMYAKFDLSTQISKRMTNPSKYGFKVGDTACCGSGPFGGIYSCGGKRGVQEFELCDNVSEYFFFDSNHPNEAASRQFAEMFWNGHSNVTAPYNLKALFQGTEELVIKCLNSFH